MVRMGEQVEVDGGLDFRVHPIRCAAPDRETISTCMVMRRPDGVPRHSMKTGQQLNLARANAERGSGVERSLRFSCAHTNVGHGLQSSMLH